MNLPMLAILVVALLFNVINGMHSSANVVSTLLSSRVLKPRLALWLSAVLQGAGVFVLGAAIASTIGKGLVDTQRIAPLTLFSALLGGTLWNLFTTYRGIPTSSTHSLIGGLVGTVLLKNGIEAVQVPGLALILVALFAAPFVGMLGGFLLLRIIYRLAYRATPRLNLFFQRTQLITAALLALTFGSNDGQQVVGVIVLGLVVTGLQSGFAVPAWVILLTGLSLAVGNLIGGRGVIHTMGRGFYKIRPVHGFAAQIAAGNVLLITGMLGAPVSTTHIISSSIVGAGAADRLSKIRWAVFDRIGVAWVLTMPAAGLCGAVILLVLERIKEHV